MLTLTQLASNGSRVRLNRQDLRWSLIGWFALGVVPCAAVGGLPLAHAPLSPHQTGPRGLLDRYRRLAGVSSAATPAGRADVRRGWRGIRVRLGVAGFGRPGDRAVLSRLGLTRVTYVGTEVASALTLHFTKIATYGAGDLLTADVLLFGGALTPATVLGAWVGKKIVDRVSDRLFVVFVKLGLLAAGGLFLIGL